ncbi:MAG: Hsp20/alpha crystallin family protein [Bacteroidetes bacterium]|nr:MAG: Hsp20/alpha crystallin family protein [Bacteroidota bacterium]
MTLVRFKPAANNNYARWTTPAFRNIQSKPVVNILSTTNGFRIELATPGYAKEDFRIEVENDLLKIAVEKENSVAEKGVRYQRQEFVPGSFERVFRLPENIDAGAVEARYANGILVLELVKKLENKPEVRTITVG